jgi:hypothetical protein
MPLPSTDQLLSRMSLTKDLAIDFFITFARFEYALIEAGYVHQYRRGGIAPDWNAFIAFVDSLSPTEIKPALDAGKDLLISPPKQLMLDVSGPVFMAAGGAGQSPICILLRGIKQARNNLFHGGKYHTEAALAGRNESVVRASLGVLRVLLEMQSISRVRNKYDVS